MAELARRARWLDAIERVLHAGNTEVGLPVERRLKTLVAEIFLKWEAWDKMKTTIALYLYAYNNMLQW